MHTHIYHTQTHTYTHNTPPTYHTPIYFTNCCSVSNQCVSSALPGYAGSDTIQITYDVPNGIDANGQPYLGANRVAYLPDNIEGREILKVCALGQGEMLLMHTHTHTHAHTHTHTHTHTCTHTCTHTHIHTIQIIITCTHTAAPSESLAGGTYLHHRPQV